MSPLFAACAGDGTPRRMDEAASAKQSCIARRGMDIGAYPFIRKGGFSGTDDSPTGSVACGARLPVFHKNISGSAGELSGFGVDLDLLALLNEERNLDLQAGFKPGELGDVARCVAARSGLSVRNFELDLRRQLQADGVAVELVQPNQRAFDQEFQRVADHARRERVRIEALLIEKVRTLSIAVEVGGL